MCELMSKELRIQTCIYSVYAYVSIICGDGPALCSFKSVSEQPTLYTYIHVFACAYIHIKLYIYTNYIYMLESVFLTLFEHGNFPVYGRAQRGLDEV